MKMIMKNFKMILINKNKLSKIIIIFKTHNEIKVVKFIKMIKFKFYHKYNQTEVKSIIFNIIKSEQFKLFSFYFNL